MALTASKRVLRLAGYAKFSRWFYGHIFDARYQILKIRWTYTVERGYARIIHFTEDIIIVPHDTYTDEVQGVKAGMSIGGKWNLRSARVDLFDCISYVGNSAGRVIEFF